MIVEGILTRICPGCLEEAFQERNASEVELNRSSLRATLGLPGACLFAIACWAVFWTGVELILETWKINVIEINPITSIIILAITGGIGWGLGYPVGNTLRQSIALNKAPIWTSLIAIGIIAVAGEILYVAIQVFRLFGIFDLPAAARLLEQVLQNYTTFWAGAKLIVIIAATFFSSLAASERKTIPLGI